MKVETGTARKPWPCNFKGCRKTIGKGQEYFLWHISPGFMAQRQHQDHGEPAQPAPKKKTTKKISRKKATRKVSVRKVEKKLAKGRGV